MRKSMKSAISGTVQYMVDNSLTTSFTEKELNALGVVVPTVEMNSEHIKEIREKVHLSQAVFAKLLNVSPSSIKQWEQGKRNPTGATKVLLEILEREPHILDYRLG
jgi:putative transcriptional regulator